MATTETFGGGQQSGWTMTGGGAAPVDTTPNDGFSNFLGRFGGSNGSEAVSKTYTFTASSSPTTISFDFNKIDSWDQGYFGGNDQFKVYLDGETAISFNPRGFSGDDNNPSGSNSASDNFTAGSHSGSYTITSGSQDSELGFGQTGGYYQQAFYDRVYRVELTLNATPASVRLGFGSTLDQDIGDESYGIDNVTTDAVCFARGSAIRVVREGSEQDVAVEHLRVGEDAVTASGALRPIRWIGHRTLACQGRKDVLPVRIVAHAFGEGRPARDLFVSPAHSICVDVLGEVLIPASRLINGSTITQVEMDEVTYWHVELDSHDLLLAEGLPAESYLDMGNRGFFVAGNVVRHAIAQDGSPDGDPAMRSHADFCRPFAGSGEIVEFVRTRLRERALGLGWSLVNEPKAGLHLLADGQRIDPVSSGGDVHFIVPAAAQDVRLVSPTSVPAYVGKSTDTRTLGVQLVGLRIDDDRRPSAEIALNDPRLGMGFHGTEGGQKRWTDGNAVLPASLWEGARGEIVLELKLGRTNLPRWKAPRGQAAAPDAAPTTQPPLRLIEAA